MAADDDLDELEAELEGYVDDDDDDDLPAWKRLWKKYKLIIIPAAAFLLFIPVVLLGTSKSGKEDRKIVVMPELAVEPGKPVKMAPEQPAGAPGADKSEEGVFNVVKEGENKGKIVMMPPPEEPKKPAADAPEAPIAMAPEGAEKTPKDDKAGDVAAMPPPTAPDKVGDAEVAELPAPSAPADGESTENILPPPGAQKVPDEKQADKTTDVAAMPAPTPPPAEEPKPKAPSGSNQLTVTIPKDKDKVAVIVPPKATTAPAPPVGKANITPLRTMAGVYRVQVASARSEAAAKTLWGKQVAKHPDLLGDLPLTVQPAVISDRGTFYRVQGGAFNDRESADSVCRKLKSRGQDCIVVRP